jgi:glycosyltransferase involved in cell wall biosynthesis
MSVPEIPVEPSASLPGISIVSSSGPDAIGGLATVVRRIAAELASTQPVQIISRFAGDGPPRMSYVAREQPRTICAAGLTVHVVAPSLFATPVLRVVRHLTYREPSQATAARYFSCAFRRPISRATPRNTQIVHSVGAGWELLGFPALQVARERDAIFTVWPAMHPGVWGDSTLDARLYRAADVVFAQSEFERTRLMQMGVRTEQIVVTGCGPGSEQIGDGTRFRTRHGLGDVPLILFIGRKQRYKGYHALGESIALLRQTVPAARLISVGPEGDLPYPDVAGGVLDLGRCTDQDKADALAACDVFCLPSTQEAFGIVYIEAWAAGKPVVGGPAPAVRELVREGVDGFCVPQEPEAVAAKLAELLSDQELRLRLGAAGRDRQQREFTWRKVAATHRDAYAEALARRGIRPVREPA